MLTTIQLLIDFLASSRGPLQPTEKFAYPDIQVGIPSMLICLEMAIFATLHIFAFSTKPYKLNSSSDPLYAKPTNTNYNNAGANQSGLERYHGGPFGILAFADAFNPWDILKAIARGFKWLFIGSRNRRTDPSYATGGHLNSESGWNSGSAFDGPETYDKTGVAGGMYAPSPTGLQNFSRPTRFNTVPLGGGPQKYSPGASSAPRGPHQGRPTASRMQSHVTDEDEDVWASGDYDDELEHRHGRGSGRGGDSERGRDSFEVGAEDRAGLLRSSAGMGIGARIGISPGRSELGESPERSDRGRSRTPLPASAAGGAGAGAREGRGGMSAFDKEAGIESQYVGYGRNSWGRDQRPGR